MLTLAIGLAVVSVNANAAVATHTVYSNAVNYCQAFTPGISNTIRNRVIGSENIGEAPIAVACNFPTSVNGAAGNTRLTAVSVFFSNGAAVQQAMTCTLLAGASSGISAGTAWSVTKSINVSANSANLLTWSTADNPTEGATDMGNYLIGVNCTLAKNMTLSATAVTWTADNGV